MRVIAGIARSLPLKSVPGYETRPTTDRIKETLFNMLNPYIPGCSFLDLYAGTGGIGIEALSRGAHEAYFVENAKQAVACIQDNLKFTKLAEYGHVLQCDVSASIARLESMRSEPFDIIFMDPPYGNSYEKEILALLKNSSLISKDTIIIYEALVNEQVDDVEALGFKILKEKKYKTNKHVWVIQ